MPSNGTPASGRGERRMADERGDAVLSRPKVWLLAWAAFTVLGVLDFQYRYLDDLAASREE